jgi:alpha-L-rhamnosidase
LYESAAEGFEDFWDPARGLYVDDILDGQRRPAAAQVAQVSAIISGLAPRHRWDPPVGLMTDSERLVVRAWVGSETVATTTSGSPSKMRGLPPIDWDAEREMVIAEPFFSYAVHDAVARAGRAELLSTWSAAGRSFSSTAMTPSVNAGDGVRQSKAGAVRPLGDLIWYVLGITPAEPGYRRVRVAPRLGRL